MASTHRQPASDLGGYLQTDAHRFNFFKLVELILSESDFEIEERELHEQNIDHVWFRANPSLGFPSSDVSGYGTVSSVAGIEAKEITVNFLGLHGASSPLPDHMLETALWSKGEEGVQQAFNDFFSHRLIWLFYLIWRKYRYYIRYKPEATDQFSDWMFALIGIKGREHRGQAGIPWAKLLTYLGVVAARTRSAEMISGVIAHAFELDDVVIRQFESRVVIIPEHQRLRLGQKNAVLGENTTIGSTVPDCMGRFVIVIKELSFQRFRDFLPSGKEYPRLKELVEFLLKDQLAYDLELHFKTGQVPDFLLGVDTHSDLGWTTFLGDTSTHQVKPVQLQMRG